MPDKLITLETLEPLFQISDDGVDYSLLGNVELSKVICTSCECNSIIVIPISNVFKATLTQLQYSLLQPISSRG